MEIAYHLGVKPGTEEWVNMQRGGLLHDIGKIGIDDEVLKKPGRLTPEEYDHIKEHVEIGHSILCGLKQLRHVLPGVRHHHEAYSGKGYPHGLRGEDIPFIARILAVADAYDAMASHRPYRDGLSPEAAEEILRRGAGDQWDNRVVDALFQCKAEVEAISRGPRPCGGYRQALNPALGRAVHAPWCR